MSSSASLNVSDRVGDDPAAVATNWQRVGETLPGLSFVRMRQVHGTRVVRVDRPNAPVRRSRRTDRARRRHWPGRAHRRLRADAVRRAGGARGDGAARRLARHAGRNRGGRIERGAGMARRAAPTPGTWRWARRSAAAATRSRRSSASSSSTAGAPCQMPGNAPAHTASSICAPPTAASSWRTASRRRRSRRSGRARPADLTSTSPTADPVAAPAANSASSAGHEGSEGPRVRGFEPEASLRVVARTLGPVEPSDRFRARTCCSARRDASKSRSKEKMP